MNVEDLILVSVDDHVVEPAHVFEGRLPAKYQDKAPRLTTRPDGSNAWVYEGNEITQVALNAVAGRPASDYGWEPTSMEEIRRGCYDVKARVKDMDAGGVLGSLNFASFAGYVGKVFVKTPDKDQAAAMIRAYNDWHVDDWCASAPGRFIPLGLPMMWDAEALAVEVRRLAAKGCHAISFSSNPVPLGFPSLYSDHWDPFWKACVDEGTMVCMHIGSSSVEVKTSDDAPPESIYSLSPIGLIEGATDVLWSPMFRKFPELRVSLTEGGIGWIPYFLERVDYIYQHTRHWTGLDLGTGVLPSDVFREHVVTCFIEDAVGIESRHRLNLDNVCWELDYPHADTQWPHAPEMVMKYLDALTDDEINKITHLNAMKHFRYDPFAHIKREDATVGALRRQAADWDTSIHTGDELRAMAAAGER